jgi:hypothetical protein
LLLLPSRIPNSTAEAFVEKEDDSGDARDRGEMRSRQRKWASLDLTASDVYVYEGRYAGSLTQRGPRAWGEPARLSECCARGDVKPVQKQVLMSDCEVLQGRGWGHARVRAIWRRMMVIDIQTIRDGKIAKTYLMVNSLSALN